MICIDLQEKYSIYLQEKYSDTEIFPRVSSSSTKGVGVKQTSQNVFSTFFDFLLYMTVDRFKKYNQVLIFSKDMISANYKRF